MLARVRAVLESGLLSFLLFSLFAVVYQLLDPKSIIAILLLMSAHYITVLLCGYWAGWRARVDGWLYGLLGYGLFRLIYYLLPLKATLPFGFEIKVLGILFVLALLLFGAATGEQRAHYVEGAPASVNKNGFYPIIKRLMDIVVASIGLILLAPVMLAVAIGIKLSSPGPIFFHQRRIGQNGRVFNVVKFRTMCMDAEAQVEELLEQDTERAEDDPRVFIKDDPRVYPFGKFLRLSSLDELPQLINMIVGDMSLVGPRPWVSAEIDHCKGDQLRRLEVKPGLTGWAQVNGRKDASFDDQVRLDLEYVANQSFLFDLQIFFLTIRQVLTGRGAY